MNKYVDGNDFVKRIKQAIANATDKKLWHIGLIEADFDGVSYENALCRKHPFKIYSADGKKSSAIDWFFKNEYHTSGSISSKVLPNNYFILIKKNFNGKESDLFYLLERLHEIVEYKLKLLKQGSIKISSKCKYTSNNEKFKSTQPYAFIAIKPWVVAGSSTISPQTFMDKNKKMEGTRNVLTYADLGVKTMPDLAQHITSGSKIDMTIQISFMKDRSKPIVYITPNIKKMIIDSNFVDEFEIASDEEDEVSE
jgi:hypothetical protein